MGYQIKDKLSSAPFNLKVHSAPVPVDEDAWAALMDGKTAAQVADEVRRIKATGTDAERAAIKHYPAFYPFK